MIPSLETRRAVGGAIGLLVAISGSAVPVATQTTQRVDRAPTIANSTTVRWPLSDGIQAVTLLNEKTFLLVDIAGPSAAEFRGEKPTRPSADGLQAWILKKDGSVVPQRTAMRESAWGSMGGIATLSQEITFQFARFADVAGVVVSAKGSLIAREMPAMPPPSTGRTGAIPVVSPKVTSAATSAVAGSSSEPDQKRSLLVSQQLTDDIALSKLESERGRIIVQLDGLETCAFRQQFPKRLSDMKIQIWLLRADGTALAQSANPSHVAWGNGGCVANPVQFWFRTAGTDPVGLVVSIDGQMFTREIKTK